MWKKLYSNSGLILLAVLAAGIWFSNLLSLFPAKSAPEYISFDAAPMASPAPIPVPSVVEPRTQEEASRLIEEILNATARCKDGTLSRSSSKQAACSRHGGIAQWFPPLTSIP